jgi:hypothetical protein
MQLLLPQPSRLLLQPQAIPSYPFALCLASAAGGLAAAGLGSAVPSYSCAPDAGAAGAWL